MSSNCVHNQNENEWERDFRIIIISSKYYHLTDKVEDSIRSSAAASCSNGKMRSEIGLHANGKLLN